MSVALHDAVLSGVVEEVEQLLQEGVDTDAVNSEGHTALHLAAQNGYRDIVRTLLDGSAQSEPAQLVVGPLVAAAAGGHVATVLLLVEAMQEVGMDINAVDDSGMTALEAAVACRSKLAVCCLRNQGARWALPWESSNPGTNTDLILAAQRQQAGVVRFLLNSGADVTIRDSTGSTALHAAASSGCMECLMLILAAADDKLVNAINYQAQTPLHLAAAAGHTDAVQLLLYRGASASAVDRVSRSALYMACKHGHADVVQQLIEAGADTSHITQHGSPLDAAVQGGHTDVARVLIASGAPVDAALAAAPTTVSTDTLETLLTAAALLGNVTVLDCLLQHSAQQVKSMTQDSPPTMTKDQVVLTLVKSAVAVADSDKLDAAHCWAVMQKLLRAAADINRASTAAALQHTLPQQSFRVAAVFAKMWIQVSDALAAADSQPDVNKKTASLQRLVGKMAVAYDKQQQDALQQEPSVKVGPDQDAVVAGMLEKGQQQLLQLRHELATSRRDLQDVLQELHRVKEELGEKQAAGCTQLEFDRAKLWADKDEWEAQQAERAAENARLQEQEAACRGRLQEQQAELRRFQERHLAIKRNLSSADHSKQQRLAAEQAQLEADQAELAADRAKLQEERVKFASELDAERFSMREAVKAARGERSMQIWRLCAIMLALVLFATCRLY